MKHILSVDQFSREDIDAYCDLADSYACSTAQGRHWSFGSVAQSKILANLFYEPSTRTSSSFYAAMIRLGGHVIPINNVQYSSVAKGETLEDTIRTMQCYSDVIVLRHPLAGAAQRAAAAAAVPIINAGDGDGEHPTQALLDFYTIRKELGTVENIHVLMMGDLLRGRTVKSLAKLLRKYRVRITWVSPDGLRIPPEYVVPGEIETADLASVISTANVLYVTRVQHERSGGGDWVYGVTPENMAQANRRMVLMHPLPRLAELPVALDDDPRAAYFRQMQHGLFMRMAILTKVLMM